MLKGGFVFDVCRNDSQRRPVAVVSEKDSTIQERQCTELPHEVTQTIKHESSTERSRS